jgi:hypothetical protein
MSVKYITNSAHKYFEIKVKKFNLEKTIGCMEHKTLDSMQAYICEEQGLALDEITGNEIIITEQNNDYFETDGRGCTGIIELEAGQSIEKYITG